jgi:hypothetical protein
LAELESKIQECLESIAELEIDLKSTELSQLEDPTLHCFWRINWDLNCLQERYMILERIFPVGQYFSKAIPSRACLWNYQTAASAVPTGSRFSPAVQTWANFWIYSKDRIWHGPAQLETYGETAVYQLCRKIEVFKTAYIDKIDERLNVARKDKFLEHELAVSPELPFSYSRKELTPINRWFLEVLQQSSTATIILSHETELRSPTCPHLHPWLRMNLAHWVEESRFTGLGPLSNGAIDSRDDLEDHDDNSTGRGEKNDQGLPIRPRGLSETAFNTSGFSASGYPQDYWTGINASPLDRQPILPRMNQQTSALQHLAPVTKKTKCPSCQMESYACQACTARFRYFTHLRQHQKDHILSSQYFGWDIRSKPPPLRIPSPVSISPLPPSPGKIPCSFPTDDSSSNDNNFFNGASGGAVTFPQTQAPDGISEPVNGDMQALGSWETRVSKGIQNIYHRDDIHSSEMEDFITSNPKKRKNPFGESKDIQFSKPAESESFSKLFGKMLELKLDQQQIRFPDGNEYDMTGRIVDLAEKAFTVYMGVHGLRKDP